MQCCERALPRDISMTSDDRMRSDCMNCVLFDSRREHHTENPAFDACHNIGLDRTWYFIVNLFSTGVGCQEQQVADRTWYKVGFWLYRMTYIGLCFMYHDFSQWLPFPPTSRRCNVSLVPSCNLIAWKLYSFLSCSLFGGAFFGNVFSPKGWQKNPQIVKS